MPVRFLSLVFLFSSCARPKYLSQPGLVNPVQKASSSCDIQFAVSKLCVALIWEIEPKDTVPGQFLFQVWRPNRANGSLVPVALAAAPRVELFMPDMGHGSLPVRVSAALDDGTYRATQVFFNMPGRWEIRFQVKDGEQIQDQAVAHVETHF